MKFSIQKFKPKPLKGLECLNCGQPLTGHENYCSYCGQKNTLKKLSIGVFFNNIVSGFFSYDSRFWRTFIPLLTKPGYVSKEFISGRRVRFVNPFQMYLNVSVVFFLILGISNRFAINDVPNNVITFNNDSIPSTEIGLKDLNKENLDSLVESSREKFINAIPQDSTKAEVVAELDEMIDLVQPNLTFKKKDSLKPYVYFIDTDTTGNISVTNRMKDFNNFYKNNEKLTPSQALDSMGYEKTFWNKFYYQQMQVGRKNIEEIREDKGKSFTQKMMSQISIALFVFLPIFTLFLKIIYIRRKFTYMEHLVFVFHTQTVFFLLLTIFYLLNFMVAMTNFAWVFIILFLLYLYKALRYFYNQGRIKTIVKFILLNAYYMFLASIGLTIVAVLSFLTA